jgi:hypothetical protein
LHSTDLDAELELLHSFTWEELLASEVGTKDVQVRVRARVGTACVCVCACACSWVWRS